MAELVITRTLDAPREQVWAALTDPGWLARWYSPAGFSVAPGSVTVDARAGGHQRLTLVADSDPASTAELQTTFTEVVPGERLTAEGEYADPELGQVLVSTRTELADAAGGGTELVVRQSPVDDRALDSAKDNWDGTLAKLDALFAG